MSKENPKHYAGQKKIPFNDVPAIVLAEVGVGMHEGARKYGAYNYRRDPILASDYYDAANRHLKQWYELGEDVDPTCGLSHITKAICALIVLRDAQINGMCKDDRPPAVNPARWSELEEIVNRLREQYPEPAPRFTKWEKANHERNQPVLSRAEHDRRVDDAFDRAFEKLSGVPHTWRAYGTSPAAAVETGEYFEHPVKGYTR